MMANINPSSTVDLAKLFGSVAQAMLENQKSLNAADSYNHDHGDNMVQTFNTITQAIKANPNASAAAQLGHASAALAQNKTSGSAQLYAEGLKDAASQFAGQKSLTINDAMQLVQTLLGSTGTSQTNTGTTGTNVSGGADVLGSLLGALTGDQSQPSAQTQTNGQPGIDLGDILNAGMAYMQAKQSGSSTLDAALNALVSGSKVANQDYRSQSATLVANALVNAVTKMAANAR
jgi:hypothetical protein